MNREVRGMLTLRYSISTVALTLSVAAFAAPAQAQSERRDEIGALIKQAPTSGVQLAQSKPATQPPAAQGPSAQGQTAQAPAGKAPPGAAQPQAAAPEKDPREGDPGY